MAPFFQCPGVDCARVYAHKQSFRKHWRQKHGPNIPSAIIVDLPPRNSRRRNSTTNLVGSSSINQSSPVMVDRQSSDLVNHSEMIDQPSPEFMNQVQHDVVGPVPTMVEQQYQHSQLRPDEPNQNPSVSPIINMPVMQNIMLKNEEAWKKRLEGIDTTPEGLYDAYGVIARIQGVNRKIANQIWKRIVKVKDTLKAKRYQFLNSLGQKKQSIPVLTLDQIRELSLQLPGRVGKQNRDEHLEIVRRLVKGDRDLIADVIHFADRAENTLTLSTNTVLPMSNDFNEALTHQQAVERHMTQYEHGRNVFLHDAREGEDKFLATTQDIDVLWDHFIVEDEETSIPREVILVKEHTTGYVKLCFTVNVYARLNFLQTANARQLHVVFSYQTQHYMLLKHMFAEYLKTNHTHVRGDWYELSTDDLKDFVCNGVPQCLENLY